MQDEVRAETSESSGQAVETRRKRSEDLFRKSVSMRREKYGSQAGREERVTGRARGKDKGKESEEVTNESLAGEGSLSLDAELIARTDDQITTEFDKREVYANIDVDLQDHSYKNRALRLSGELEKIEDEGDRRRVEGELDRARDTLHNYRAGRVDKDLESLAVRQVASKASDPVAAEARSTLLRRKYDVIKSRLEEYASNTGSSDADQALERIREWEESTTAEARQLSRKNLEITVESKIIRGDIVRDGISEMVDIDDLQKELTDELERTRRETPSAFVEINKAIRKLTEKRETVFENPGDDPDYQEMRSRAREEAEAGKSVEKRFTDEYLVAYRDGITKAYLEFAEQNPEKALLYAGKDPLMFMAVELVRKGEDFPPDPWLRAELSETRKSKKAETGEIIEDEDGKKRQPELETEQELSPNERFDKALEINKRFAEGEIEVPELQRQLAEVLGEEEKELAGRIDKIIEENYGDEGVSKIEDLVQEIRFGNYEKFLEDVFKHPKLNETVKKMIKEELGMMAKEGEKKADAEEEKHKRDTTLKWRIILFLLDWMEYTGEELQSAMEEQTISAG